MCIAIPSKVISTDGVTARVECYGQERDVSLLLMNETVAIGDYLIIQSGNFAVERMSEEEALKTLELFDQVLAISAE